MAYLGKTPSQAVRSRYYFTASGGETSLAPAQVTGLSFTDANYVDVSLNGVALVSGTDYTATPSTNTISSLAGLTASDVVEIVVYDTFSVFGGSVNGDFTISNGTLAAEAVTVTGLTTTGNINFGDNDKAIFGAGSDLQIYHTATGNHSIINESGGGDLQIQANKTVIQSASGADDFLVVTPSAGVQLSHNASGTVGVKLATTSTGVDVTGTVGINTASPAYTIDAASSGNTQIHLKASGQSDGLEIGQLSADGGNAITATNNNYLKFGTNNTERLRITNGGNVGISTSSPIANLEIEDGSTSNSIITKITADDQNPYALMIGNDSYSTTDTNAFGFLQRNDGTAYIYNAGSVRAAIDSSGNVGISTTSPEGLIGLPATASNTPKFRLQSASTNTDFAISSYADANGTYVSLGANHYLDSGGNDAVFETTDKSAYVLLDARNNGTVSFGTNSSGVAAERMRIDSSGRLGVGKTPDSSIGTVGFEANPSGQTLLTTTGQDVLFVNRKNNDGLLVRFFQDGSEEGNISVSGSTVSYNGGHLSRWSQATDGNRITGLVKGTVMTNLDQMAEWTKDGVTEENEQLNCMAVSSVEGDANVAGVFVNWDDDDTDFTADMNVAMTGDMVIRIASGTTVARGDLLMSAGDGTAKPQGDDIVRSKTIAKVTSTTVSHTYDDGTYLVPCVLMAC